jgi:hypothetical protein
MSHSESTRFGRGFFCFHFLRLFVRRKQMSRQKFLLCDPAALCAFSRSVIPSGDTPFGRGDCIGGKALATSSAAGSSGNSGWLIFMARFLRQWYRKELRSRFIPTRILVLIVTGGTSSWPAICSCVRPANKASSIARRCSSGNRCRASWRRSEASPHSSPPIKLWSVAGSRTGVISVAGQRLLR